MAGARSHLAVVNWACRNADQTIKAFIGANEPCLVNGLTREWPALEKWILPTFENLYGDRHFSCGLSETNNSAVIVTLREYLRECSMNNLIQSESSPLYIFDSTFDADCEELLTDYSVPTCFKECLFSKVPEQYRPNYRWLLVGNPGSGSLIHVDPLLTSAWNSLTYGEKRWCILEGGNESCVEGSIQNQFLQLTTPTRLFNMLESLWPILSSVLSKDDPLTWYRINGFSQESGNEFRLLEGRRLLLFNQHPGQTVFIPRGWLHGVINVSTSIAITHNFLRPFSRQDLYSTGGVQIQIDRLIREWRNEMCVPDSVVQPLVDSMLSK